MTEEVCTLFRWARAGRSDDLPRVGMWVGLVDHGGSVARGFALKG